MNIIGLHNDEDAGACLMRDGTIVAAANEERFSRTKLHKGVPELSLQWVLQYAGLTLDDVDCFAYGWYGKQTDYGEYARRLAGRVADAIKNDASCAGLIDERLESEFARDEETRREYEDWMRGLGVPGEKMAYLDHHSCHAWSAFACSPFDAAFVLTADGRGDLKSGMFGVADTASGIEELDYRLSFDSLGFLYGQITHYLGYRPHRHEGKVTGLAALGDPEKTLGVFEQLFSCVDGRLRSNLGLYRPFFTRLNDDLVALLKPHTPEDIAAGLQTHCERVITQYAADWIKRADRPDIRNICLSGGLFANVKINQRIGEIPGIDQVYVFPHMGDGGLAVGAACHLHHNQTGATKVALPFIDLGNEFSDDEIRSALEEAGDKIVWTEVDDVAATAIDDLANDRVVGLFQGRMELGPRSLGCRSILYHTRDNTVNDWLNRRLHRTEFMPFAPVTPIECADRCYKGWQSEDRCSRLMTRTYDCYPEFTAKHPAVVHVDGTARPQIVDAALNGVYYDVVRGYCDRTGEMALINTSFNQHEEPIVCTPANAIGGLLERSVDVLMIGSFRVVVRQ